MKNDDLTGGAKRRRWIVVGATVLLILVVGAWMSLRGPSEPVYQGKPLSAWLAEYNSANWPRKSMPADVAIRAIGTNGFPTIRRLLKTRDSTLKLKLYRILYQDLHLHFSFHTQQEAHLRAVGALGALGREAKPLVPTLAESLKGMDTGVQGFAGFWLESLGSDGEAAIPVLITRLNDTTNPLRHLTVETLAYVGVNQTNVVLPVLEKCLQDSNQFVRLQARNEFTREPWVRFGMMDNAEYMRRFPTQAATTNSVNSER